MEIKSTKMEHLNKVDNGSKLYIPNTTKKPITFNRNTVEITAFLLLILSLIIVLIIAYYGFELNSKEIHNEPYVEPTEQIK